MKLIIIILLLSLNASATTYYVSNTGSDAANGTSTGTAWQTMAKVNSSTFTAGDFILFKKGDSWNERLSPPSSGSAGNVITYGAYGTGAAPIITGFQTLSGWTNSGNIWSSTFSNSVRYQNTVYINGSLRAKGRYPNNSYLTFTSHSAKNQITGALTGTPNYTGGNVVIRNNKWTLDRLWITSQSSGTINFTPDVYYSLTDGYGYFISNIESVLDTLNEYCYDTTTKVVKVYATSQPTVKASSLDTLVFLNSKNYITFDGIDFEGSNLVSILANSSSHVTITNCNFNNSGGDGIAGESSTFLTITNNSFSKIFNCALQLSNAFTGTAGCNDAIITGNTVRNIGIYQGMGKNRFGTYTGLNVPGDRSKIKNNDIDSIGYIGISFLGADVLVKNNVVSNFCFVKDDGGGIYTWQGTGQRLRDTVRGNIVFNGRTAFGGTPFEDTATAGIYMDNETTGALIDSNTVYNTPMAGIYLHLTHKIILRNNNVFCDIPVYIQIADSTNSKNNTFAKPAGINANIHMRYFPYFVSSDSNNYYNAYDTNKIFTYYLIAQNYSLKRWQDSTGFDLNSKRKPSGITSATPILKVNSTAITSAYSLTGTYKDFNGNLYYSRITLPPYSSMLLFKNDGDLPPPTQNTINVKFKRVIN
jgi:parallel beta-helix repeat protein